MERQVRAHFNDDGIVVYQAFKHQTVAYAANHGTFGQGFGFDRWSWIKPSFAWMLYRSQYASKHRMDGIARVWLSHEGFELILKQAISTYWEPQLHDTEQHWCQALAHSDVRYQWDPERDLAGYKRPARAIQLGLTGQTLHDYVEQWILRVEDATPLALSVGQAVRQKSKTFPQVLEEREYPLSAELKQRLAY